MKLLNSATLASHIETIDANNAPQTASDTAHPFPSGDLLNATNDDDVAVISDYLSLERRGNHYVQSRK
jgi:hypothetical protein